MSTSRNTRAAGGSSPFIPLCCLTLLLAANFARAQGGQTPRPKRVYQVSRLDTSAPAIDGRLDDTLWKAPEGWEGGFIQYSPHEGEPALRQTRFKIVHDKDHVYAAIHVYEVPGGIRRVSGPRDRTIGDLVGIAFDSYHNGQTAYEFDLTAAGQKVDVMYLGGGYNYDFNWNPVWEGAVAPSDSGWAAEFRIPLSQLRYNDQPEHEWGLHVWRKSVLIGEESMWNLMPSMGVPGSHNFGIARGIAGIRGSRRTELLPFVSLKADGNTRDAFPGESGWSLSPDAGLDVKAGLSSNFTVDATVNPDFGQVEADPSELNLTGYETYLEEKRPFFLEGKEVFDYGIRSFSGYSAGNALFYSRRLGAAPAYQPETALDETWRHPENTTLLASAKLAGRTRNGVSIGVLETVTKTEYGTAVRSDSTGRKTGTRRLLAEPFGNWLAARVKRETDGAESQFGASFNSMVRDDRDAAVDGAIVSSAHTFGIDGKRQFHDREYFLTANAFGSHLRGSPSALAARQESPLHAFQRPDAGHLEVDLGKTSLSGAGGFLEGGRQSGLVQFWVNAAAWSPGLDLNDMGYLKETDLLEQQVGIYLKDTRPKGPFRAIEWDLMTENGWSFGGERVRSKIQTGVWTGLMNQWWLYANFRLVFPALDTRELAGGPALYRDGHAGGYFSFNSDPSRRFQAQARYAWRANPSTGQSLRGHGMKLSLNPIDRLTVSADMGYDSEVLPYQFVGESEGRLLIGRMRQETASLVFRAEVFLTPKLSVQYYGSPFSSTVDYSRFQRVAEPGAADPAKRFRAFTPGGITFDADANTFEVSEDGGSAFGFDNPDESFGEFRSNLVFRWEYQPGSLIYLVWTRNQGSGRSSADPELDDAAFDLFDASSRDVIMAKLSYWFNL